MHLPARLFTGCWINSAYLCEHPGIFSENSHPGVFSWWPVALGLFARGDRVTCQGLYALAQWALGPNGPMHVVEFLNNSAAHLHLRCMCRLGIVFFSRTDKSVRSLAIDNAKSVITVRLVATLPLSRVFFSVSFFSHPCCSHCLLANIKLLH